MAGLVTDLANLITEDNSVFFIGTQLETELSGLSLEAKLIESLVSQLDQADIPMDLATVARDYETMFGRQALLQAIIESLQEVGMQPQPIHQVFVDTLIPGAKVVTTRYDQLLEQTFEQSRKPYVLIVRDTDLPFFDEAKITLIKLQGDVGQPDSLVITDDDIDDRLD